MRRRPFLSVVVPAKAGTHGPSRDCTEFYALLVLPGSLRWVGPGLRRDDETYSPGRSFPDTTRPH
jgi:hypothetical protein